MAKLDTKALELAVKDPAGMSDMEMNQVMEAQLLSVRAIKDVFREGGQEVEKKEKVRKDRPEGKVKKMRGLKNLGGRI